MAGRKTESAVVQEAMDLARATRAVVTADLRGKLLKEFEPQIKHRVERVLEAEDEDLEDNEEKKNDTEPVDDDVEIQGIEGGDEDNKEDTDVDDEPAEEGDDDDEEGKEDDEEEEDKHNQEMSEDIDDPWDDDDLDLALEDDDDDDMISGDDIDMPMDRDNMVGGGIDTDDEVEFGLDDDLPQDEDPDWPEDEKEDEEDLPDQDQYMEARKLRARSGARMVRENKELKKAVSILRKEMGEQMIAYKSMRYMTSLFEHYPVSRKQKMAIVKKFDKARNLHEIKLVYSAIKSLLEARPVASRTMTSPRRTSVKRITESVASGKAAPAKPKVNQDFQRWSELYQYNPKRNGR